jgi:hypothetical protein
MLEAKEVVEEIRLLPVGPAFDREAGEVPCPRLREVERQQGLGVSRVPDDGELRALPRN